MERFDPRGCHLRTSEIMHLFSQHMTKVPEILRFQELFFCIPNFFLLIYFCPFSATNTLTNMAIVPEQHLVSYSLWHRDGRSG